jgi:hypothetical protein
MILLTLGIAVLDLHTRLTCLETDASLLAALIAAAGRRIVMIIHFNTYHHRDTTFSPFFKLRMFLAGYCAFGASYRFVLSVCAIIVRTACFLYPLSASTIATLV